MPYLERKPDQILVKHWWSESAFDTNKPLTVPIFSFQTGEYSKKIVELE